MLSHSQVVKLGKDVRIDPSAVIRGPTTIGDNVFIGPGAVIDNSIIGSNVSIGQGCQVMLSVVGDGSFLPFRASLFMTTLMENSMVAQNTCLQMCVVGRDSFIGAGSTFTDFNLVPRPIKTFYRINWWRLDLPVIGGCVGHNCRLGVGADHFPGAHHRIGRNPGRFARGEGVDAQRHLRRQRSLEVAATARNCTRRNIIERALFIYG